MKVYLRGEVNKRHLGLRAFILAGGRISSQSVSCADRQDSPETFNVSRQAGSY